MDVNPHTGLMDNLLKNIKINRSSPNSSKLAERFAGKWTGTMPYADFSTNGGVVVIIQPRLTPGKIYGALYRAHQELDLLVSGSLKRS
jgi:hypothetical protein